MSQQYFSTGNSLQENNKRRKTEPMMVAHDHTLEEDIRTLKQSSIPVNYSMIPDKEVDSQGDRNIVDSGKGHNDAEEKKSLENVDLHHEASRTAHECSEMVHGPHGPDNFGMQNQMNSHAKEVADQDLGLCKQNGEKTNFHQDQGEEAPVAESAGRDSPSIAIACSEKINSQEKVTEVSPGSHPEILCSKSDSTSGASIPKEGRPSDPHQVSPELEERQPVKVQVEVDMKNDLSVNNANTERFDDGPNKKTQCVHESQDHIQSSQPQQLPVFAKSSSSELAKTETSTLRCEGQPKQEVANSQAPQLNNLSLAGQNMQQQWPPYTMPQNVQTPSQTQDQLIAQPNQGNQQYLQMTQGYASQMWQYYQQQMFYLQAQHNQQMQSLQQQQLPTEHLQQNFLQQVQQLNQQMVLWQQQVQQQQQQLLQQALPVQQQPDNKQGQSSSGDTKNELNKHQQQASQMDNQSQQLQQQQLLYFQQQQQQMYLMQQQQMYQQQQNHQQQQQLLQQQLMQQQYLLQRPQQQQDSVQQQQLFQQQQQQMLLLQQQQQQFIQQQMQQYTQQQQTQQGPKDQSYKLNPQGRRNHQMEHGQQSETSQSDGSKRRSVEQSELSYPSTPQSQRSNH